jgi:hypothetical protein
MRFQGAEQRDEAIDENRGLPTQPVFQLPDGNLQHDDRHWCPDVRSRQDPGGADRQHASPRALWLIAGVRRQEAAVCHNTETGMPSTTASGWRAPTSQQSRGRPKPGYRSMVSRSRSARDASGDERTGGESLTYCARWAGHPYWAMLPIWSSRSTRIYPLRPTSHVAPRWTRPV